MRFTAFHSMWVSAIALMPLASAHAQGKADKLEEVIVSARKTAETVQTIPISMSAISSGSLENQSIANIAEIQGQVPNLFLQKHPSEPQSLSLAIRGQKQNDIVLTLDPSVGIYVDNLYYPRTMGLRGALVDVERIEVLRGPQGTLYGRNTTGGAMSIFTKDPTPELGGSIELTAGNYGATNAVGILNVPIADNIGLRLVGQQGKHDGYGEDGLGRDLADEDGKYIRGKLVAELTPAISATLFGSYQDTDAGGAIIQLAGIAPNGGRAAAQAAAQTGSTLPQAIALLNSYVGGRGNDIYKTSGTTPAWSKFTGKTIGLDISAELTDEFSVRSISGYEWLKRENNGDYDGTPITLVDALRETDTTYASQELQLLGAHDTVDWMAGLYYGVERGDDSTTGISIPALNPAVPNYQKYEIDQKSYAVFTQANWAFAEDWRLTLGARYSWDDRAVDVNNYNVLNPCLVPAEGVLVTGIPANPDNGPSECPRTFQDDFSDPSWLVSLDHTFSEQVMGYVKVARGYRAGGRNVRGANRIESFAVFDPETVTEYEFGVKSELLDHQLQLNLAVFFDDYKNIQRSVGVSTATGAPTTIVTNAASGTIQGFEVDARWLILDNFTLMAGVGLTDAKYDEFEDLTGDRSSESFGVPEWTANLSANYTQPMDWGKIVAQIDYHWQDDIELVPETPSIDQLTQDAYGLLNARLSVELKALDMDIALFGKNLEDKEYFSSGVSSERNLGYNYAIVGEPRTFGVELVKRFGGI